ncbi:uncharacterized protein EV154DRAFT_394795, partial [Mucor mucedo]
MEPNESIEVFIERFIQLKRQAATVDPTILISRFINALPVELSNQVTFILTGASDTNKRSLIYVMSLAKDLYTKLFQFSNNLNMLNSSNNGSSSRQHLTGRQNNLYEGHVAKKRPITNSNTCILHKNGRHTSEECHTNQNDQPRRCFQCDFTPWTKDHVCATNNANEQPLLTFRSMTRINNTRPTTFPTPPPNVDEDMEMDDPEESFDKFSKSCKLNIKNRFEDNPPLLPIETNSIIVPIILEGIKTWALIDSGSSFSCVTPSLSTKITNLKFSPSIIYNKNQFIKLAHKESFIERIGILPQLTISHNGITLKHDFEIF